MGQNLYVFIIMVIIILALTIVQVTTPYITRRTQCFGISIPKDGFENQELIKYRKSYVCWNIFFGALLVFISVWAAVFDYYFVFFYVGAIIVDIAASFFIYYIYHIKTKTLKTALGWAASPQENERSEPYESQKFISAAWLLIYPVIIIITAAYALYLFPSLPGKIAMQYDFYGNVTRYADKTIWSALFAPIMQIFLGAVFSFVFFVIKTSRGHGSAHNTGKRATDIFKKTWGYFMIFGGAALLILFFVVQLSMFNVIPMGVALWACFTLVAAFLIISVVISIKVGQGGSRLGSYNENEQTSIYDDDRYWKLGSIYVNKNDKALFVEKRFGVGWTINFGRPAAYWIMAAFVLAILLIMFFSFKL